MSSSTSFTNSKALPRLPVVHEVFGREFLPEPCVDLAFAHGLPGTVQGAHLRAGRSCHGNSICIIYTIICILSYYI